MHRILQQYIILSSYKQDINFVTNLSKTFYTHMTVKNVIVKKLQKYFGYEVASSLNNLEEYVIEVEIPTRIMSSNGYKN